VLHSVHALGQDTSFVWHVPSGVCSVQVEGAQLFALPQTVVEDENPTAV
jgi:hypothetical protein